MKVRKTTIAILLACWALCAGSSVRAESKYSVEIDCDPAKVLGAESCAKCHESEVQQWQQTPHFATFETLHRNPKAKEIAKRLDLSSVKRNDVCVKCHYTQQQKGERVRVVSGISCESCHGAGMDWVPLHNDYGGPSATKAQESAEHAQQRIEASIEAGMNNPSNLYLIARQCLTCHSAPDEQLVNVGGHPTGSGDFELVAWSQGMVRHNFLRSGNNSNVPSSIERLRVMYVVGMLADLEASFRATALATSKDVYGIASAQRAARLKHKLYEISQQIPNEHLSHAVDAALSVPLKLGQSEALVNAADEIGAAASEFAETANGKDLAVIDSYLPSPQDYK